MWSLVLSALVAVLPPATTDNAAARRNQSGSLNYAPRPGMFLVVTVDSMQNIVRLRARNGAEADVHVDPRAFDLDRLRPGDVVQVDFLVPNDGDPPLSAATICPVR